MINVSASIIATSSISHKQAQFTFPISFPFLFNIPTLSNNISESASITAISSILLNNSSYKLVSANLRGNSLISATPTASFAVSSLPYFKFPLTFPLSFEGMIGLSNISNSSLNNLINVTAKMTANSVLQVGNMDTYTTVIFMSSISPKVIVSLNEIVNTSF